MFYYIFLVLVLLLPLRNVVLKVPALASNFGLMNILYLLVLLGIFLAQKNDEKLEYRAKVILPLLLYVAYFFLQIFIHPGFHSYDKLLTWWKDSFLFALLTYLFVSRAIREPKKIIIILAIMCFASVYMDTYYWRWVRWMSFDMFNDKLKAVNGTFGDIGGSNEWAAFFSTYALVVIAVMNQVRQTWQKYFLRGLATAHVAVLLYTFSRGSYLGFLIGLLYLLIKQKKYLILCLILCLPLFYATILPKAVTQRVEMSFEKNEVNETADQNVESRLIMWKRAIEQFTESPVVGHGMLSFRYEHWRNAHNQHLNTLVEGGVIGYSLFLWIFIGAFRDAKYLSRVGKDRFTRALGQGMCAAIVSLFIANIFGDRWSYYVITGYFWVLMGTVTVLLGRDMPLLPENANTMIAKNEDS